MQKATQTLWTAVLTVLIATGTMAQAPDKAAPFTAVKWDNDHPVVRMDNEWYSLLKINDTDVNHIIEYCKKKYDSKYQKRFSEDLVEVLQEMNMSPGASVKLELEKDGIAMVRNVQMTKDNRQLVWKYNNEKTDIISTNKIDIQKQHNDKKYEKKYSDKKVIHTQAGLFTIKAARITYEYSGMTKGTDILYFDDYGETVVLIQNRPSEIYGGTKTIIYRDGRTTIINHDRKNAAKSAFRPKDTEPPSIATASNRESEGYEKLPNESIAGRECEVYHNNTINAKYWLWNNIDLRLENYSLGNNGYIKSATNVQIISAIPTELFLIPEGYEKRYNK